MPKTPPPSSAKPLGQAIRKLREKKGLTILEVADKGGVDAGYLTNIELGKVNPSLRKIQAAADGLNVSLSELFCPDHQDQDESSGENRANDR